MLLLLNSNTLENKIKTSLTTSDRSVGEHTEEHIFSDSRDGEGMVVGDEIVWCYPNLKDALLAS